MTAGRYEGNTTSWCAVMRGKTNSDPLYPSRTHLRYMDLFNTNHHNAGYFLMSLPPLSGKGMLITLIMKSLPCVKTEPRTSAWQFLSFVLCNYLCKHVQSDILLNVIIFGYLLQGLGTYSSKHTHKGDSHLEGMFHIRWEILVMISTIFGWFWVSRCWD